MTARKGSVMLVGLAAILGVVLTVSAVGAKTPRPSIYWGAYVGGAQYGLADGPWEPQSTQLLEQHAGKGLSLIEWGQEWFECSSSGVCGLQPFPAKLFDQVRAHGSIPVLSWGSGREQTGPDQPAFRLAAITGGTYDAYLKSWAQAAKRWGKPFFLRFDWEMNGHGEPWDEAVNGNGPGDFVRMWRHVRDVFKKAGATNVTWVWCPNIVFSDQIALNRLYPGPTYVDWVGLDGYNWGEPSSRGTDHWITFTQVFAESLRQLASIAPTKPVMIGETASSEHGGSKAAWILDALQTLPTRYPQVKALVWFNKNWDGQDWVIETSPEAQAAFAQAIGSPAYASNAFAGASQSPIRPLG